MDRKRLEIIVEADPEGFKVITREAKRTGDSIDRTSKRGSRGLKALQRDARAVAKAFAVLTAAATALSAISIKFAIDFESSFTGIRKTVDATENQFALLEQQFRDLAKIIPVSVNELNKIGELGGQLAVPADDLAEFSKTIAELAVTTNIASEEGALLLAQFAGVTDLPFDQIDNLASAIVDLGNNSRTTENSILQFASRIAASASIVGLSQADILGFSTALASTGLQAEAAGTAISRFLREIQLDVDQGSSRLAQFAQIAGISIDEFSTLFKEDAAEAVALFAEGLNILDVQGDSVVSILDDLGFEGERLSRVLLLLAQESDQFREQLIRANVAFEQNTALSKEAELRFKTTASQLKILGQNIQDAGITLGNAFLPFIRELVPLTQDYVVELQNWAEENEEVINEALLQFVEDLKEDLPDIVEDLGELTGILVDVAKFLDNAGKSWDNFNTSAQNASNSVGQFIQQSQLLRSIPILGAVGALRDFNDQRQAEASATKKELEDTNFIIEDMVENSKALVKELEPIERGTAFGTLSADALDIGQFFEDAEDGVRNYTFSVDEAEQASASLSDEIGQLSLELASIGASDKELVEIEARFKALDGVSEDLLGVWKDLKLQIIEGLADQDTIDNLNQLIDDTRIQRAELNLTGEALINFQINTLATNIAMQDLSEEGLNMAIEKLKVLREELIETFRAEQQKEFSEQIQRDLEEAARAAENSFQALEVFAGETLDNISQNFSDFTFNALKGNFDSIGDLWEGLLDSMLKSFIDFIAAVATQDIILNLGGLGGRGGGAGGVLSGASALGGLGDSFGALGSLFGIGASGAQLGAQAGFAAIPFGGSSLLTSGIGASALAPGFLSTLGAAIPAIGAIASVAAIAIPLISDLFKSKPRLDLDFDQFRDETGKSLGIAADVISFLDEDLFRNEIFSRSVSRKAGLGLGDQLPDVIQDVIEQSVNTIQGIINQLPTDIATQLNETLLNAEVDIESQIKGDRLLEFDESGKRIGEKFQSFLENDLPTRFFASIRESFFDPALQSLGISSDATQSFIDQFLEDLQGANREQRGQIGQQFIQDFQTFVDAFNIVEGNFGSVIDTALAQVRNLSSTLGFDAIPSIAQLDTALADLLATTADPAAIREILDLRNAIIGLRTSVVDSIISITSNIESLNSTIVGFGGVAFDTSGAINQAIDSIQGALSAGGLSLEQREGLLGQLNTLANQLLAQEQAAQQAAQNQRNLANERRRGSIEAQISSLRQQRELIEENFRAREQALNDELRLAESLLGFAEQVRETADSILLSSSSVLTPVEQVNFLQSRITELQGQLSTATGEDLLNVGGQLESAFSDLFNIAGEAFGVNSPEFVSIFGQVTTGLENLATLTENRGRSVEEINSEIERITADNNRALASIDARIASSQNQLSRLAQDNVNATTQVSAEVQALFNYLRDEAVLILNEQLENLAELEELTFQTEIEALNEIASIEEDMLITLRSIEQGIIGIPRMHDGGMVQRNGLHNLQAGERVLRRGEGAMSFNITVNGSNSPRETADTVVQEVARNIRRGGVIREAIDEM